MAQITPTISNGLASIPKQATPYFAAFYRQIEFNGVSKNVLSGPPSIISGILNSTPCNVAAFTTWAELVTALTALGINTSKLADPTPKV